MLLKPISTSYYIVGAQNPYQQREPVQAGLAVAAALVRKNFDQSKSPRVQLEAISVGCCLWMPGIWAAQPGRVFCFCDFDRF